MTSPTLALTTKSSPFYLLVLGAIWLLLVGSGFCYLLNYASTPGTGSTSRSKWPGSAKLKLQPNGATLVMALHPRCACSRASLSELARLLARNPGRLSGYILAVRPPGAGENWEKTDLWYQAASIPGIQVLSDINGAESSRFAAVTSGQTFVYDANGALLFRGGITGARGHAGDNRGEDSLVYAVLNQDTNCQRTSAVFGCPIFSPELKQ